jgi:uncharacterized protein (TIGR03435 family)
LNGLPILAAALGLFGQSTPILGQTTPGKPHFEAISIKPSGPFVVGNMRISMTGGPGSNDPARVVFERYVLSDIIDIAYDLRPYQLSGPAWLINPGVDSPRFNITATMPEKTSQADYRLMLQRMLTERFGVVSHYEKKELPVYNLVVGKNGPKLNPPTKPAGGSTPAGPYPKDKEGFPTLPPGTGGETFNSTGGARLQAVSLSMEKLASLLSMRGNLDRPVHDATGLDGEFDFVVRWQPNQLAAADADSLPTIFDAVEQQLGLKLESGKAPVDVLAIDHIEKEPTGN